MAESPLPGELARSPLEVLRSSLVDGFNRYKSMKDAPESRKLLTAFLLGWIGSRMNMVALVVLSFQIGEGALGVGGMLAVTLLPNSLFQPVGGTLVDKYPGKQLLIITYALFTLLAFSYLLLIPFASIWLLYVIRFLSGAIQSVESAAFEVRLMKVTASEKRGTANAVQAMGFEIGEIVGPLLGGAILALAGVAPIFLVNALTTAFLGYTVWRLPDSVPGAHRVIDDGDTDSADEARAASQGGYRWLLKRPEVIIYLALSFGSGLISYGIMTAFVSKALDIGMNEGSVGAFFSAIGVGALIGGLFAGMGAYTSKRALVATGIASSASALSIMLFGVSNTFIFAVLALFLYGLVINIEEIPALTYFQNRLPETVYGRFFSTWIMAASLGGFAGSLLVPVLLERYSLTFALTALAVPGAALGMLFAIRAGGLKLRRPFLPATTSVQTDSGQLLLADVDPPLEPVGAEALPEAVIAERRIEG